MVARELRISYKDTGIVLPFRGIIKTSSDIYRLLKSIYPYEEIAYREHFYALYLASNNKFLGYKQISSGGITSTVADVRVILQGALLANATTLVIAHNHPSGNLMPSVADIELTKRVYKSASIMDIRLIDHMIISEDGFYSFADENNLNF